tara:strand:- start:1029 stop:1988 length:960 start_codon:yes stop_codon:yes gene_type:complete
MDNKITFSRCIPTLFIQKTYSLFDNLYSYSSENISIKSLVASSLIKNLIYDDNIDSSFLFSNDYDIFKKTNSSFIKENPCFFYYLDNHKYRFFFEILDMIKSPTSIIFLIYDIEHRTIYNNDAMKKFEIINESYSCELNKNLENKEYIAPGSHVVLKQSKKNNFVSTSGQKNKKTFSSNLFFSNFICSKGSHIGPDYNCRRVDIIEFFLDEEKFLTIPKQVYDKILLLINRCTTVSSSGVDISIFCTSLNFFIWLKENILKHSLQEKLEKINGSSINHHVDNNTLHIILGNLFIEKKDIFFCLDFYNFPKVSIICIDRR